FPLSVVQSAFDLSETPERQEVGLTFVEFVKFLKRCFCVGKFHYEDMIISAQIDEKIEEFSKCYELQRENHSKFDFARFLDQSNRDEAFMRTITEKGMLIKFESISATSKVDTTSRKESEKETDEKLSLSSSGLKSEQNVSTLEDSGSDQASGCTSITDLRAEFQRQFTLTEADSTSNEKPVEKTGGKIPLSPSGSKDASKGEKIESFSRGKSSKKIGGKTPSPSFGFKDSFASKQNVRPLEKGDGVHQPLEKEDDIHQPLEKGDGVHQPLEKEDDVHQPLEKGDDVHQP
ncbi:hypothetical protein NPIL_279141, partial [Nephila pilipes]